MRSIAFDYIAHCAERTNRVFQPNYKGKNLRQFGDTLESIPAIEKHKILYLRVLRISFELLYFKINFWYDSLLIFYVDFKHEWLNTPVLGLRPRI